VDAVIRLIGRLLAYLALLVLGAAVGVAGSFVQAATVDAGPVPVPFGLVIALGGCAGLFMGGAWVMRTRLGAVVPAVAWLLAVLVMSSKRPEGDVVLPQQATAYGYLFIGTLVGATAATFSGVRLRQPVAASSPEQSPSNV
jgi:Family of unknown function (DUF6113)